MAREYTKEFIRQQIGGIVPEGEQDQCGYCGGWFTVTPRSMPGVCSYDQMYTENGLTSEGYW